MHQKQAISLFSGAGGLDVGFVDAGFEVVWANDIDKDACATYEANLGSHVFYGDIRPLLEDLSEFRGIDCVFGGPPCQGFSVAGKMNPNDPRSELVQIFMKAVEIVQPKVFVMENVKALAVLEKFKLVRQHLFEISRKMGYSTDLILLNSKDYGVPQGRERMFLVGVKTPFLEYDLTEQIKVFREDGKTLREVILPLGRAGSDTNSRICRAKITIAQKPVLRRSPYAGMLFNGQGRPLNPDGHSCSLHASMGGNKTPIIDEEHLYDNAPSWVEEYHAHLWQGGKPYSLDSTPAFLRRLTVDEALLIQTFPPNYNFLGSQSSVFRQIGNAVPCKLAEAVAKLASNIVMNKLIKDYICPDQKERQLSFI